MSSETPPFHHSKETMEVLHWYPIDEQYTFTNTPLFVSCYQCQRWVSRDCIQYQHILKNDMTYQIRQMWESHLNELSTYIGQTMYLRDFTSIYFRTLFLCSHCASHPIRRIQIPPKRLTKELERRFLGELQWYRMTKCLPHSISTEQVTWIRSLVQEEWFQTIMNQENEPLLYDHAKERLQRKVEERKQFVEELCENLNISLSHITIIQSYENQDWFQQFKKEHAKRIHLKESLQKECASLDAEIDRLRELSRVTRESYQKEWVDSEKEVMKSRSIHSQLSRVIQDNRLDHIRLRLLNDNHLLHHLQSLKRQYDLLYQIKKDKQKLQEECRTLRQSIERLQQNTFFPLKEKKAKVVNEIKKLQQEISTILHDGSHELNTMGTGICPICLKTPWELSFPCGHGSCKECFTQLEQYNESSEQDELQCPTCRSIIHETYFIYL